MKAMILAAGLGTRLRPITTSIPKALVRVQGLPILEIIIRRLAHYGFKDIVINLHYLPDPILSFLKKLNPYDIRIQISHETDRILDTGGGIKKARKWLDEGQPFLVHNVDVLSDIDLLEMYHYHLDREVLATLAVKNRNSSRSLLFDRTWRLSGWENRDTEERKIIRKTDPGDLQQIGFCGIHVISPKIFDLMQDDEVFSIINTYVQLAAEYTIVGFPAEENLWMDIGSHQQLREANRLDPGKYLK
jgi:NDP-sugar pyrophosphorylase family protein